MNYRKDEWRRGGPGLKPIDRLGVWEWRWLTRPEERRRYRIYSLDPLEHVWTHEDDGTTTKCTPLIDWQEFPTAEWRFVSELPEKNASEADRLHCELCVEIQRNKKLQWDIDRLRRELEAVSSNVPEYSEVMTPSDAVAALARDYSREYGRAERMANERNEYKRSCDEWARAYERVRCELAELQASRTAAPDMRAALEAADKFFYGWCPTATCCAASGLKVHDQIVAALSKARVTVIQPASNSTEKDGQ